MESLLKLIAGNAGGPESGELASGGAPAFRKHTIKGRCGSFLRAFPLCRSQGHSVYITIGQTARHQPRSLAPQLSQPVPPVPASPAVKDAEQHPPESWTAGPGCHDVEEERVGKKGWGRLIFSALVKNQDWLCRLRRGYSRPASQLLVSFQAWRGKSSNACPVSAPSSKAQPFWL